jgi:hypothetical protein
MGRIAGAWMDRIGAWMGRAGAWMGRIAGAWMGRVGGAGRVGGTRTRNGRRPMHARACRGRVSRHPHRHGLSRRDKARGALHRSGLDWTHRLALDDRLCRSLCQRRGNASHRAVARPRLVVQRRLGGSGWSRAELRDQLPQGRLRFRSIAAELGRREPQQAQAVPGNELVVHVIVVSRLLVADDDKPVARVIRVDHEPVLGPGTGRPKPREQVAPAADLAQQAVAQAEEDRYGELCRGAPV